MGDSVQSVGTHAFDGCSNLVSIVYGQNVKSKIEQYTFAQCFQLKSIIISAGIKTVDYYAFNGCASLKNVFSLGNVGYNTITVNNYTWANDNKAFIDATKYSYRDNEPTTTGNYWHFADDGVTPIIWDNSGI